MGDTNYQSQADGKFDQSTEKEASGKVFNRNVINTKAEDQVRENEDTSLPDDTYAFDSDDTGNEDIHDVDDFEVEEKDDDSIQ